MSAIRFVVIAGEPGSGKTDVAQKICNELNRLGHYAVMESFMAPIKSFVTTALSIRWRGTDRDAVRPELRGYSVNDFAEQVQKRMIIPLYGAGALGEWLMHRVLKGPRKAEYVVVDDGVFESNIRALTNRYVVGRGVQACDAHWNTYYANDGELSLTVSRILTHHWN